MKSDYSQDCHEYVQFQSIGFEGNMAELIPPTVTKAASRQQMVVSLGNLVFITVITVVHLDRVVGESIFMKFHAYIQDVHGFTRQHFSRNEERVVLFFVSDTIMYEILLYLLLSRNEGDVFLNKTLQYYYYVKA